MLAHTVPAGLENRRAAELPRPCPEMASACFRMKFSSAGSSAAAALCMPEHRAEWNLPPRRVQGGWVLL
jgi:hypothetical protein